MAGRTVKFMATVAKANLTKDGVQIILKNAGMRGQLEDLQALLDEEVDVILESQQEELFFNEDRGMDGFQVKAGF